MSNDGASMLSEEILLRTLSYTGETRDVIAAAGTCRSWRNIIRGPKILQLIEAHYPSAHYPFLLTTTPNTPLDNVGWFNCFVRIETLCYELTKHLGRVYTAAESIRERDDLFGQYNPDRIPYEAPTSGTTATSVPDANGHYAEPVYYDWGSNWERVSELVETQEVQQILMQCVNEVSDDYYFNEWDESKIWPFLFVGWRRYGNGEQSALINKHLSASQLREVNGIAADWLLTSLTCKNNEYTPRNIAVRLVELELESGEETEEEAINDEAEEMVEMLRDSVHADTADVAGSVSDQVLKAAEAILYSKNGPGSIREVLLCTVQRSHHFMPLNYILAKLVSPDDANLTVCVGSEYSVVYDEERNILFDNFWYFCGVPASEALEKSRRDPLHPFQFDYTLGGLVN